MLRLPRMNEGGRTLDFGHDAFVRYFKGIVHVARVVLLERLLVMRPPVSIDDVLSGNEWLGAEAKRARRTLYSTVWP